MITLAQAMVVMSVSGYGKTMVGQVVAKRLGYSFCDGDDFHHNNLDKNPGYFWA